MWHKNFDKIYVKDFDSNILNTDISIILEKINWDGTFTTKTIDYLEYYDNYNLYSWSWYRLINNDPEEAFQNARDYLVWSNVHPGPDIMLQQVIKALQDINFSPSMYKFVDEVLKNANLFCINTARGNGMDTLKQSIYLINQELLSHNEKKDQIDAIRDKFQRNTHTDMQILRRYLDVNCYFPVSNREFCKLLHIDFDIHTSEKKTLVMDWYITYITKLLQWYQTLSSNKRISLWFSDDTYKNVEKMLSYFLMISSNKQSPHDYYKYRLYFTWPNIEESKEKFEGFLYENFVNSDVRFEYQKSQTSIITPDILKIIIDK